MMWWGLFITGYMQWLHYCRVGTTGESTAQSGIPGRSGEAWGGDSAGQAGSCGAGQAA